MSLEPKIQYCLLNVLDVLYAFVLFSPFAPQFVIMNSPVRSLPSFLCLLSHTRIHQMLPFIYQLHCHSTIRDFKLLFGPFKFFCGGWESFQAQTFVKWFSISNVVLKKSSARFANSTPLFIFSPSPRNMIHLHRRCWEWLSANTPLHMWERLEETTTFPGSRDQPVCVTCQTARVPAHLTKCFPKSPTSPQLFMNLVIH